MAAFDLNSLYFLKNAAPKAASFEELNAPTERGFNLGRAYNENYNRNSLQNLIAQREKEGVPYDRLSNEAAKWDLGAAQAMRNERRSSLEYNYKQSVAEFEQWRRNMARRICGLILQKADELGIAPEELDRVLNIAASYVVTYDEALAQWLLGQAGSRRASLNRLNKPAAKNNGRAVDLWTTAQNARAAASQYDPTDNAVMYWGLMNYATAAEAVADRELEASRRLGDRIFAEKNDVLRLLSYFKNRNKKIDPESMREYALSDKFHLIAEKDGIEDNVDVSDIVTPEGIGGNASGKKMTKDLELISEEEDTIKSMLDPKTIRTYPRISKELFQKQFERSYGIEEADDAIKYLQELKSQLTEDSARANKGAGKTEGTDKNYFELIDKEIAKREQVKAEYKKQIDELKSLGVKNPEDAFKKFKELFGQRASIGTVLQFRNFNSFVNSYISKAPMTAISNGLLVGTPNYKPTVEEFKTAKSIHGSLTDDMRNYIRRMGVPIASVIADAESEYPALWALASDVQKQIRAIWNSVSGDLPEDEYKQIKKLYTDLFHIDKNAWDIIEGSKDFPMNEEYERQLNKMQSSQKKNNNPADLSGIEEPAKREAPRENTNTISAEEWLKQNGGL